MNPPAVTTKLRRPSVNLRLGGIAYAYCWGSTYTEENILGRKANRDIRSYLKKYNKLGGISYIYANKLINWNASKEWNTAIGLHINKKITGDIMATAKRVPIIAYC